MKKFTIPAIRLAAVLLFSVITFSASAQFRYGPIAGVNFNNLHFKQDLAPVSGTVGGQAGLQAEMMFPGIGFGIDLGFVYNMTGAKVDLGDRLMWQDMGYGHENLTIHQINIPFHLRFKYTRLDGLEDIIAPFVYGGPDFNIQVAHSSCGAMEYSGGDLGLTAGIGAELYRHWQISAQHTWGMTYALKATILQNYSANTRQWSVRVAYLF